MTTDAGGSVELNGFVTTSGAQTFNDATVLAANIALTTTNSNVRFGSTLNSAEALVATPATLSITAGTGDVSFAGIVGGAAYTGSDAGALGAVALVSAKDVTIGAAFKAASLTQSAGTGLTTIDGATSLTGALTFTGAGLTINAAVTADGAVTVANSGIFTTIAAGTISSVGAFSQSGTGANSLGGNVSVTGTGNADVTVNSTGLTKFGNSVDAASLTTNAGGSVELNGDVTTSGAQTYNEDVVLTSNVTLSGASISIQGDVDSDTTARSLAIFATDFALSGGFGANQRLLDLAIDAANGISLSGAITTDGTQTYNGNVTLTGNTSLIGTDITLNQTVKSGNSASALTVTGSGTTTFAGTVGAGTGSALASLTVDGSGTTLLTGGSVTTTGAQNFGNALTLGENAVLTTAGGAVSFAEVIDSATSSAARNLTVDAGSGAVTFTKALGATEALADVTDAVLGNGDVTDTVTGVTTLNVSGASSIGASLIDTASSQTYTGAITLTRNAELKGVGLELLGAVDGAQALILTDSGTTKISGAVGVGTELASLEVKGDGTVKLAGGTVKTSGTQTYSKAVALLVDTTLEGSTVSTGSTLTGLGDSGNYSLTVTGDAAFGDGTDADSFTDLTSLSVSGNATLNLAAITTSGTQTYSGDVSLAQAVSLTTTSDANVSINGTLNGGFDFTATTGTGNVRLTGAVGGSTRLGTLHLANGGLTIFGSSVTAASLTTDTNGSMVLGGDVTTTTSQTYNDAVFLIGNVTLTGTNIALNHTVDSDGTARRLTVTDSGTTTFGRTVGADSVLASLTVNGGGTTLLNGGSVSTTDGQTFVNALTLGADTNLTTTSGGVFIFTTVNSAEVLSGQSTPASLSITAGQDGIRFLKAVGQEIYTGANGAQTGALGAVTLNSSGLTVIGRFNAASVVTDATGSVELSGGVTTTGIQTYNEAVVFTGDRVLTGTDIAFNDTLKSLGTVAGALTVTGSGTTTFAGTVGAGTGSALASLTVNGSGTTLLSGGSVTTTGAQNFGNALTLGANAVLTTAGGAVSFAEVVDTAASSAARNLTVDAGSGAVTFTKALGATEALADVTVLSCSGMSRRRAALRPMVTLLRSRATWSLRARRSASSMLSQVKRMP
ncbi:MAG: hypothetical protein B7Y82_11695 [Sphingomonadales bacterium 32-65-25]|nr:MAG: hypothetical protein B7Y82_11695 [Sphingomonadales bacterium 32-65-25]